MIPTPGRSPGTQVAAPSKATSYAPESFDMIKPKPLEKPSEEEDPAQLEREFEQEFLVNRRSGFGDVLQKWWTRIRGAKERAIAPGPRLDRHPDEDEVLAYQTEMANRKPSSPSQNGLFPCRADMKSRQTDAAAGQAPAPVKKRKSAGTPKEKVPAKGDSGGESPGPDNILYKRVALGEQEKKKARGSGNPTWRNL
eukprot:s2495_g5.t1